MQNAYVLVHLTAVAGGAVHVCVWSAFHFI